MAFSTFHATNFLLPPLALGLAVKVHLQWCKTQPRQHAFSVRVVPYWNKLAKVIVNASFLPITYVPSVSLSRRSSIMSQITALIFDPFTEFLTLLQSDSLALVSGKFNKFSTMPLFLLGLEIIDQFTTWDQAPLNYVSVNDPSPFISRRCLLVVPQIPQLFEYCRNVYR